MYNQPAWLIIVLSDLVIYGVIAVDLFADVDFDKTANRVDKLLKYKLPRLARRCGRSLTDLSSPQLSSASSHSNRTDGQERMMVNSFSIGKVVDAICQTIYHCSDTSRIVLIGNYIKYTPQEQLIMKLPYEKTYYYSQLKPIALNEFADGYDYWQDQCDVELEDKIDLHVYVDD